MKILAIDTSTFLGSVALVQDDELIVSVQQGTQVTYSERLIAGIEYLMAVAGWKRSDIDLFAVANGPGSFTGLRIGIATAKGLAVALEKPLVGVSSLEALACGAARVGGTVVAVIDARRDEVYAAGYRFEAFHLREVVMPDTVCTPDELCARLGALEGDMVLVGDGARRYRACFEEGLGARALFPADAWNFPHGAHLAALARKRFEERGADEIVGCVPNYIRLSDAEIGFRGRSR